MLRFGRPVVARRAHLEAAHQFVADVANDQGSSHDCYDIIDRNLLQTLNLSLLRRGALFDDPATDELEPRALPGFRRSADAAGARPAGAGAAGEGRAHRRSRLRARQFHGVAGGTLARGCHRRDRQFPGDACRGPRERRHGHVGGGRHRGMDAGWRFGSGLFQRGAAVGRRPFDAAAAVAEPASPGGRAGRPDAAQFRGAVTRAVARDRPERAMGRSSRRAW